MDLQARGAQAEDEGQTASASTKKPKRKYLTLSVSIPTVEIDGDNTSLACLSSTIVAAGDVYKEEGGKKMPIDELFIVYNLKVKVQGMASWIMPCR